MDLFAVIVRVGRWTFRPACPSVCLHTPQQIPIGRRQPIFGISIGDSGREIFLGEEKTAISGRHGSSDISQISGIAEILGFWLVIKGEEVGF